MNRTIETKEDRTLTDKELNAVTGGTIRPPTNTTKPIYPTTTGPTFPVYPTTKI
jgi:bacteriocin-like protein